MSAPHVSPFLATPADRAVLDLKAAVNA